MKSWDQLWQGDAVFVLDPEKEILHLACCDCGSTHEIDFKAVEGGIKFKFKKLYHITKQLRHKDREDYSWHMRREKVVKIRDFSDKELINELGFRLTSKTKVGKRFREVVRENKLHSM